MKEQFTLFSNIKQTTQGSTIGIDDVVQITTSSAMKGMIDYVRESTDQYSERKKQLPNITVNGVFSQRNDYSLVDYSGVVCIDFDHIPAVELLRMKNGLRNWQYAYFLFTSPSGEGLKLFIRHDLTDPSQHQNLYLQMVRTFKVDWGCQYVDDRTKDLSRATFLSYDPDFFYNPAATVWHYEYDPSITLPVHNSQGGTCQAISRNTPMTPAMITKNAEYQASWADKTLVGYIDKHQWDGFREDYQEGHRNDSILRKAGQLFRCGVHYDVALAKLIHLYSEVFSDMPPSDVESRVHYIYSTASEEDYGCQRQEWKRKRDDGVAEFLGKQDITST